MADTLDLFGGGEPDPPAPRLDPVAAKKQREAFEYLARKSAPPQPTPQSVNALCVHPGCGEFGPWGWLPTNSRWCTAHLPEWWKNHGTPLAL